MSSTKDRQDEAELVESLSSVLEQLSESMAKATTDESRDAKAQLTAMMMGLTAASAAGLLKRLWRDQENLRAAVQAAIESLESVPDAGSVRVMLEAALVES